MSPLTQGETRVTTHLKSFCGKTVFPPIFLGQGLTLGSPGLPEFAFVAQSDLDCLAFASQMLGLQVCGAVQFLGEVAVTVCLGAGL